MWRKIKNKYDELFWNRSLTNFWLWFQSLLLLVWCHMHMCVLVCSYVLEFDDDEEDGSLPQRVVPFHKVVALPEGHRQWIFFSSSVHKCEIGVQCCENHSFKAPYVFLTPCSLAKLLNFLSMLIGVNTSRGVCISILSIWENNYPRILKIKNCFICITGSSR